VHGEDGLLEGSPLDGCEEIGQLLLGSQGVAPAGWGATFAPNGSKGVRTGGMFRRARATPILA